MKALVQRVKRAKVEIEGEKISQIGQGILILIGISAKDEAEEAFYLATRCSNLRIFDDGSGKMNLSVKDVAGEILIVSQFTLCADTTRGNRPSYSEAASPPRAEELYEVFIGRVRSEIGGEKVKTGRFGGMMDVHLVNDGPVTVMIESKNSNTI